MIKLIATDIDGTLLKDGTLMIDPEYMTVINHVITYFIKVFLSTPTSCKSSWARD